MGLFDFLKKEKNVIVPESDADKVNWFFTDEAKAVFKRTLFDVDEMWNIWKGQNGASYMIGYTSPEGNPFRKNFPCTFFADYLRALKTMDAPRLAVYAVDLAMDGDACEGIPYPDCLKAEHNPLINFAIKIKPIYHSKYGEGIKFDSGMNLLLKYLHDAYAHGMEDESNESWMYEKELWFNDKGKVRDHREIEQTIKEKVKHKELLI